MERSRLRRGFIRRVDSFAKEDIALASDFELALAGSLGRTQLIARARRQFARLRIAHEAIGLTRDTLLTLLRHGRGFAFDLRGPRLKLCHSAFTLCHLLVGLTFNCLCSFADLVHLALNGLGPLGLSLTFQDCGVITELCDLPLGLGESLMGSALGFFSALVNGLHFALDLLMMLLDPAPDFLGGLGHTFGPRSFRLSAASQPGLGRAISLRSVGLRAALLAGLCFHFSAMLLSPLAKGIAAGFELLLEAIGDVGHAGFAQLGDRLLKMADSLLILGEGIAWPRLIGGWRCHRRSVGPDSSRGSTTCSGANSGASMGGAGGSNRSRCWGCAVHGRTGTTRKRAGAGSSRDAGGRGWRWHTRQCRRLRASLAGATWKWRSAWSAASHAERRGRSGSCAAGHAWRAGPAAAAPWSMRWRLVVLADLCGATRNEWKRGLGSGRVIWLRIVV